MGRTTYEILDDCPDMSRLSPLGQTYLVSPACKIRRVPYVQCQIVGDALLKASPDGRSLRSSLAQILAEILARTLAQTSPLHLRTVTRTEPSSPMKGQFVGSGAHRVCTATETPIPVGGVRISISPDGVGYKDHVVSPRDY